MAQGSGAAPAAEPGSSPAPAADSLTLQKENLEEQKIQELTAKLESLKGEIAARTKKADKINKIMGGPGLYTFCATTLGVMVGGAFGLAPIMLGVMAVEGAVILAARLKERKIEKSITPLAQEAYMTQQQIDGVKEIRDMDRAAARIDDNGRPQDDSMVSDDDDFVFIDGVKLRKQSHQTADMLRVIFQHS